MRDQVVGLFPKEGSVADAANMLHDVGYSPSDLDLVSVDGADDSALAHLLNHVRPGRLLERPEGVWPWAIRGALIGSLAVEVPVLIWVFLAFDSWGIQVFLASTLWKIGTLLGGMLGAIIGLDRGLEPKVARRYQEHLALGTRVLAARVRHGDAPQTRAIFIESGAFDVRNVEGRFIAKKSSNNRKVAPDKVGNNFQHPETQAR